MCFKKLDNPNRTDGSAKKTEAVKDWILFFGELVKASVDGVVEFWGEDKKEAETVVQPVVTPEADVIDLCEELNEEVELEETAEKVEEAVSGPTAKELKQQVKALRRAQKLARKEEKKALKVEKRGEKLLRKQEKQERDQDKKQKKNEHKAEKQQKKDQKKAGYIPALYTGSQLAYYKYDLGQLSDIDIWYAFYNDTPALYYNYMIWQYSCTGRVDGIEGDVDLNICFKNYK